MRFLGHNRSKYHSRTSYNHILWCSRPQKWSQSHLQSSGVFHLALLLRGALRHGRIGTACLGVHRVCSLPVLYIQILQVQHLNKGLCEIQILEANDWVGYGLLLKPHETLWCLLFHWLQITKMITIRYMFYLANKIVFWMTYINFMVPLLLSKPPTNSLVCHIYSYSVLAINDGCIFNQIANTYYMVSIIS